MTSTAAPPTPGTGDWHEEFSSWCDRALAWPLPGSGATGLRLDLLGSVARSDVVLGRVVEAHADAVAILAELHGPVPTPGQRWAVWAAGPAQSVTGTKRARTWRLTGTKHWCSASGMATHALVDAATTRGQDLFAVDLSQEGITLEKPNWAGAGMARSDTRSVSFDSAPAEVVGEPGEYLTRRGFWAGAVGVAACWHGGAVGIADKLLEGSEVDGDPYLSAHLGAVHAALWSSRAVLAAAAEEIDRTETDLFVTAGSARAVVERDSVEVINRVCRALGPGPLAHDARHAAAVFDLTVYLRQHHGERDLAELGRRVAGGDAWQPR